MRYTYICLTFIICIQVNSVFGQADNRIADSLINYFQSHTDLSSLEQYQIARLISGNTTNPGLRLSFAQKALENAEKLENLVYKASACLLIGQAYIELGEYTKALEVVLRGKEYYQQADHNTGLSVANSILGRVYKNQGNYKEAIKAYNNYLQNETSNNERDNLISKATIYNNIGNLYYEINEFDSALKYLHKSLTLSIESDFPSVQAYSLATIGLVYGKQANHNLAIDYINQATEILILHKDRFPIISFNLYLSEIFDDQEQFENAIYYAKQAFNIAEEEGFKPEIRDASEKLALYYKKIGNTDKAYFYLKKYYTVRDSINNLDVIQDMANLRTEYEISQKQEEVDYLQQIRKVQRILLFVSVGIFFIISILSFLLFKGYRNKVRLTELLKNQNKILISQHKELKDLNYTKDRLFSIISHDLRSPVSALTHLSELIKEYIDDKEKLVSISEAVEDSSKKLLELLDNLLNWAMNQQGKIPFNPVAIQLKTEIDKLVALFIPLANSKEILLESKIENTIFLYVDINSFSAIFRNLINNALKYTNEGGKIILEAVTNENFCEISVIDNGVGIPEDKINDIFLFKNKKSTPGTKSEMGVGLGLSIAYEFSRLNGGTITVESEINKGTSFTVVMPVFNQQAI